MAVKLIVSYKDLSHAEFATKALGIVNGLSGNPKFPLPWPSEFPQLAELAAAQAGYAAAVGRAADKGKGDLADRDARRVVLARMIRELAAYVEAVAKGSVTVLETTGYDLSRPRGAVIDIPAAPENLRLRHGRLSGSLVANAKLPKGAAAVEVSVCTGDPSVEGNWRAVVQAGSCRGLEIPGLPRGVDHYVRVRGIGRKGPGPWSNIEGLMVV